MKSKSKELAEFIKEVDEEKFNDLVDNIHDFLLDLRNNPNKAVNELKEKNKFEDDVQDLVNTMGDNRNLRSVMISLLIEFISNTEI